MNASSFAGSDAARYGYMKVAIEFSLVYIFKILSHECHCVAAKYSFSSQRRIKSCFRLRRLISRCVNVLYLRSITRSC